MPKGFIILLFSCLSLRASPIPPRHYFFNHISKSSGLVSYQVNSVVQDNEGFIWLGTNEGLQRFDGIHYRNFQHLQNDPGSIPSNFVRQLLLDKAGNLWLLSKEGKVALFDRHRFVSSAITVNTAYVNALSTSTNSKRLITDESGAVFLLLDGYELLTYNPGDHRFSAATIPGLPPHLKILSFTPEPGTHRYWYASDSGGLAVSEPTRAPTSAPKTLEPAIKSLQSTGNISIIWFDHRHRLWTVRIVDNLPEISCFDMKQSRIILSRYRLDARSIGHHEVASFYETRDGSVWIRGQQVLAKFIENKKEFEQVYNGVEEEHGIDYVMITCLLEDREGGMWVGTANNGLFYFYPSMELFTNTTYRSNFTGKKGDGAPGAFLTDKDSSLLVGIHDEGLYRFDRNMKQIPLQISGIPETNSLSVWDMRRANQHSSWIAVTHGLYRFDPAVRKAESFFPKIFEHLTVWQVCPDSAGNLWIGTLEAGLFFWNKTLGAKDFDKGLQPVAGVPPVRINRILADHFGLIWIATANQGVYLIQPREGKIVRHFTSQEKGPCQLPEASVNAMTECGDSLMVMACPGLISLYHWKGDSVEWLRHPLSGTAASVEADDRGHIWVSSSTTLFRVTLSQKTFIYYDRSDGLANDGFVPNGSTVFGGRLLFGVYGAIISFRPKDVLTGPVIPDFRLTEVTVSGRQLRVDSLMQAGTFTLSPEDNNVAFAFSAMVYNSGYLLRYSLSGLGEEWKPLYKEYRLNYPFLPPGSYDLTVEARDPDGNSAPDKIHISFRVQPHFWQTAWFYALLVLLVGGIVFWLDRLRNRRRLAVQKMRSDIGLRLAGDVSTALNNINVLSEMANLKAGAEPARAEEYLHQIRKKSAGMITAMDDMIWSIDPQNDTLGKTIERVEEFVEFLNNRNDARITLSFEEKDTGRKLNMQRRHEILFLVKEHLRIAVQSGARAIDTHLSLEQDLLFFHLQFPEDGCNQETLSHLLYSLDLEKRREESRATLSFDPRPSCIVLELRCPFV